MAITIPSLPLQHRDFVHHVQSHPDTSVEELVKPFNDFDAFARKIFAQSASETSAKVGCVNVVPLYNETTKDADIRVRARDMTTESPEQKEKYLLPLPSSKRRANGSPAVVPSLEEFQNNFALFTEGALSDMDWSNVVVAGSAVVTSLLPVPEKYRNSKRGLRQYYHEEFAPASDVDLFLYGLNEEQAIEKIKQIEDKIRNTILYETTTIRTKNAITIASQYPTRHVQIVLRVYSSVSEILTGFDVDCSCVAYDGQQVFASPRAIVAFITQTNQIDLTRRSPSYESRLSKYSHRGFEVFWPLLDRSKVDPTIFERSFNRTEGLARLLILEKLPKPEDRDNYLAKRREERGRPPLSLYLRRRQGRELRGNIKDDWEDEVPDWQENDQISDYHTFTIPYGRRFNARKIEKLLYTKDLLLNAEWNQDRDVYLHRHPAFFGEVEDIIGDCCGACPPAVTEEELKIAEEESKKYVSGGISFIKDNPGRQEIGSFNPITDTDWTAMAYIESTEMLCQAIVSHDLAAVQSLLDEGLDPNRRDYTGRTPLQLACMSSTPEIVQCLVDHDARLISRMADGQTALHLAAARGASEIVSILLTRSLKNQESEDDTKENESARQKGQSGRGGKNEVKDGDENEDDNDGWNEQATSDASHTSASYVKVDVDKKEDTGVTHDTIDENDAEPDIYDINVTAWDNLASPLHLAILHGHVETVETLVATFGADVLMPIKIRDDYSQQAKAAILTLVLTLALPLQKAKEMSLALLKLGASPAQGDINRFTSVDFIAQTDYLELIDLYLEHDRPAVQRAINHIVVQVQSWYGSKAEVSSPLVNALCAKNTKGATKLLGLGAKTSFNLHDYLDAMKSQSKADNYMGDEQRLVQMKIKQPLIHAIERELPLIAIELLSRGVDFNCEFEESYNIYWTALDATVHRLTELERGLEPVINRRTLYGIPDPVFFEKPEEEYLTGLGPDTYKLFGAKGLISKTKTDNERYEQENERLDADEARLEEGAAKKRKVTESLIRDFELLKTDLLSRGAKTWAELHPGEGSYSRPTFRQNTRQANKKPAKPFELKLFSAVFALDDMTYEGYVQMFEAAWRGDLDTIKSLTLHMWGPNADQKPLMMSRTDVTGFSCLQIAVMRGHLTVAKGILKILRVQHKVKESGTRKRFEIDSDMDADSSDDEDLRITSHVVDEQFTHENIGEVASSVESDVSPRQALQAYFPVEAFAEELIEKEKISYVGMNTWSGYTMKVGTLIHYAIYKNDFGLLEWLLNAGHECASADHSDKNPFTLTQQDLQLAIILGHTECLGLMIRSTAVGLPLANISSKSGVAAPERYYQGLSIRGQKRKDWASAGRPDIAPQRGGFDEGGRSPVLISATLGKLASTEWFLGTAPGRYYLEYVNQHTEDEAVQRLCQSQLGLEASVMQWLQTRNELILHCAVLSHPCEESEKLVQFLVDQHPECLELRSSEGHTPLALAFSLQRISFARILIKAGANLAVRDTEGCNLLHLILCSPRLGTWPKLAQASALIEMIDKEQLSVMLMQRAGEGSRTPFANWVHKCQALSPLEPPPNDSNEPTSWDIARQITHLILDLGQSSNYKFLELLDGAGNTIAHECVKRCFPQILDCILDRRPDLLYRENATGATALEMAVAAWLNETTRNPPEIASPGSRRNHHFHQTPNYKFKGNSAVESEKTRSQIMIETCQKRATMNPAKRRLVTLYEANEVTKRLAAMDRGRKKREERADHSGHGYRASRFGRRFGRYDRYREEAVQDMDEVTLWGEWAAQWR
ncbi:Uncharacterized protein PECH_002108 [Penicillium ucsense]|uniref:Ankyrin repeat protein n=1 Tax=Penicillium ucsense TaxID=2839758 RepID=A0A8J8W0J3_9EURO|nr:Uncharacterized protein PECM_007204 [Penicillium ucsense]KAF7738064.1 Uncharacterized protein PECH_002108 [Penicillium ucsense]